MALSKGIALKNSKVLALIQIIVSSFYITYIVLYISCHSTLIKLIVHIASGEYIVHSIAACTVYICEVFCG